MLGLIDREPMTGYDLSKAFSGRLGSVWGARHSQIYPELKKLREGGIECTVVPASEVQEKKLYAVTERGRAAFQDWLLSDEEEYRPPKDALGLRLYFCENLSPEQYLAILDRARAQHSDRLEWMRQHCAQIYPEPSQRVSPELGDFMLMRGGILREEAYLDWLDRCRRHIGRASSVITGNTLGAGERGKAYLQGITFLPSPS
jgi:DNA-binding PadR family transcriptional regulator